MTQLHATMRVVTRVCAIGAMLLTCSVMAGWLLSWNWLTSWSGPASMVPMSALCIFAVACVELLRWQSGSWREAAAAGITMMVLVMTVGLLMGRPPLEPVIGMVHQTAERMAYSTAASLILLLIAQWWPRAHWISLGALWAIVGLALLVPDVFGEGRWMAWPTMAALIGLSVSNRYWVGEDVLPHD